MSFYQSVELNTRERISLAPGSYGTSSAPGLKILSYVDKASKPDKSGAMRHSFLVAATRPSREALQKLPPNGNGKAAAAADATPFDEPDYDGTAFLSVTIHSDWQHPACLALAFTEATRNKEGKLGHDYVADGVAAGEFSQTLADDGRKHFMKLASDKVLASNTPEDQMQEAIEAQYRKELMQISIKIGQLFTLQDWAGIARNPEADVKALVGSEFSGKIEKAGVGDGSEVVSIWSKKK